jgi:protein-S-isoprenylcysteine O-methyltransferase Ste14
VFAFFLLRVFGKPHDGSEGGVAVSRVLVLVFGVFSYAVFFATFLYQMGFLAGMVVPKAINDGAVASTGEAVFMNVALLGLFAIQHTIMARLSFKRWWTRFVPESIERSVFVLLASMLLLLMNWQWRPMPELIWHVEGATGRAVVYAISLAGWGFVFVSTFLIDHFDLFGVRQVWLSFRGREYTEVEFRETLLYSWVRHPIMVGFMVAFWATPDMTQGHLLFAAVCTAYIVVGVMIEERTLLALHGEDYRDYQRRVSMLIPMPPKAKPASQGS